MERGIREFVEFFPECVRRAADRLSAAKLPTYERFPREAVEESTRRVFGVVKEDVAAGTVERFPAYMRELGARRAIGGGAVVDVTRAMVIGFEVITEHFNQVFTDDIEVRLWWANLKFRLSYEGSVAVFDAFYVAREKIIAEQSREILELSAPIMPLDNATLVLPLVGAITGERAGLIMQSLLQSIAERRSAVAILDVTGVPTVDARVAGLLVQAAQAARLLGARVILAGMNPEIARTIVDLGVDLGGVTVTASLQSAHACALRLQGKVMVTAR